MATDQIPIEQVLANSVAALIAARKETFPSQSEVARLSHGTVDQTTVSRILNAKHKTKIDTLATLGRIFKVPAWALLHPATAEMAAEPKLFSEQELQDEVERRAIVRADEIIDEWRRLNAQPRTRDEGSPAFPFTPRKATPGDIFGKPDDKRSADQEHEESSPTRRTPYEG